MSDWAEAAEGVDAGAGVSPTGDERALVGASPPGLDGAGAWVDPVEGISGRDSARIATSPASASAVTTLSDRVRI
ncbi:MAG: hypothetical protein M3395_06350 [Chloroflexota bacterium]|nr:hypothetical protein [Chloroflexota bacterium]